MATLDFTSNIHEEQQRIDTRCEEIDETTAALTTERSALIERRKMLENVESLYSQSQGTIDEAQETQLRLHPSASYEDDYEDEEVDEDDGEDYNEPTLKSVS